MLISNISRATVSIALLSLLLLAVDASIDFCSKTCITEQCDTIGIKYGKYCGVEYTGCPGQKPCDDLDACCMNHDDCVGKFGIVTRLKCHKRLKNCLTRVLKSGKAGFSKVCPVSTAAPTMIRGMDLAILMCKLGNNI